DGRREVVRDGARVRLRYRSDPRKLILCQSPLSLMKVELELLDRRSYLVPMEHVPRLYGVGEPPEHGVMGKPQDTHPEQAHELVGPLGGVGVTKGIVAVRPRGWVGKVHDRLPQLRPLTFEVVHVPEPLGFMRTLKQPTK